jgi:hypothetical protein
VRYDGKTLESEATVQDNRISIVLSDKIRLAQGQKLEIEIRRQN